MWAIKRLQVSAWVSEGCTKFQVSETGNSHPTPLHEGIMHGQSTTTEPLKQVSRSTFILAPCIPHLVFCHCCATMRIWLADLLPGLAHESGAGWLTLRWSTRPLMHCSPAHRVDNFAKVTAQHAKHNVSLLMSRSILFLLRLAC